MNKLQLMLIAFISSTNTTFHLKAAEHDVKTIEIFQTAPIRSDPFLSFFNRIKVLSTLISNFNSEHEPHSTPDDEIITLKFLAISLSQQYETLVKDVIPEVSNDNPIIEKIVEPLKLSVSDEEIKSSISLTTRNLQKASISQLEQMAAVFQRLVPSQEYIDQYNSMLVRKEGTKIEIK